MLQLQNISVDYVTPHVVKISLYRERQANSLSLALLEELQTILTEISEESNTRVVILTGAGEKAFCAGADLKERAGMNEEQVGPCGWYDSYYYGNGGTITTTSYCSY